MSCLIKSQFFLIFKKMQRHYQSILNHNHIFHILHASYNGSNNNGVFLFSFPYWLCSFFVFNCTKANWNVKMRHWDNWIHDFWTNIVQGKERMKHLKMRLVNKNSTIQPLYANNVIPVNNIKLLVLSVED